MSIVLKRFDAYQESCVRWVDELPAHWRSRRIKTFLREVDERSGTGEGALLTMRRSSGLVPLSDFSDKIAEPHKLRHYKLASPGQIVMNPMQAGNGMFAICNAPGLISPDYRAFELADAADPRYLIALFKSEAMRATFRAESKGLGTGTAGFLRLYPQRFGSLFAPFPPPDEQHRIADFLDAYTTQIHQLISGKRRVKKLVAERREEIVRRLVFRGLDENAELADSNVAWVGQTPEGWSRVHLGSAVVITPGYPFDARLFASEDGAPLIRIRDLIRGYTELRVGGLVPVEAWVDDGDLLVGMDGDFNSVIWTGGRAALNQRLCCLRPSARMKTSYLALVLPFALKYINDLTFSTTVKHLSIFDLRRLRFPAPTPEEQGAIVADVEKRTKDLDVTLRRLEAEIHLILEYRDSLIAAVVTGRLDVRDAEIAAVEGDDMIHEVVVDDPDDLEDALDAVD